MSNGVNSWRDPRRGRRRDHQPEKDLAELEYELGLVEPSLIVNDGIDYGLPPPTSRPPTAINSARWTPSRTARLQSLLTAWAMMI